MHNLLLILITLPLGVTLAYTLVATEAIASIDFQHHFIVHTTLSGILLYSLYFSLE
jgi:hypothetical protein